MKKPVLRVALLGASVEKTRALAEAMLATSPGPQETNKLRCSKCAATYQVWRCDLLQRSFPARGMNVCEKCTAERGKVSFQKVVCESEQNVYVITTFANEQSMKIGILTHAPSFFDGSICWVDASQFKSRPYLLRERSMCIFLDVSDETPEELDLIEATLRLDLERQGVDANITPIIRGKISSREAISALVDSLENNLSRRTPTREPLFFVQEAHKSGEATFTAKGHLLEGDLQPKQALEIVGEIEPAPCEFVRYTASTVSSLRSYIFSGEIAPTRNCIIAGVGQKVASKEFTAELVGLELQKYDNYMGRLVTNTGMSAQANFSFYVPWLYERTRDFLWLEIERAQQSAHTVPGIFDVTSGGFFSPEGVWAKISLQSSVGLVPGDRFLLVDLSGLLEPKNRFVAIGRVTKIF